MQSGFQFVNLSLLDYNLVSQLYDGRKPVQSVLQLHCKSSGLASLPNSPSICITGLHPRGKFPSGAESESAKPSGFCYWFHKHRVLASTAKETVRREVDA